ncbi:MAG: PqqD family protein [Clostridia bacterium]|nr:PqqD family protein [Clostridia bacterium]
MRLKGHYETMTMNDTLVAVTMGDDAGFNGAIRLNKTAAAIFELLREETGEEAIVDTLCKRFGAPREKVARDVHATVASLRERGLII